MNPDRWARIDELCQAALARDPADRAAFLSNECAGDADLLREVESLLAQQSQARDFLELPAAALDDGLLADVAAAREALAPGTRLGPYDVVSRIGAGGMGEVYKARDTRLGRTVAIKVLPPELSADPDRRARFTREAKIVAALSHPHICPLYDVGERDATDGRPSTLYLVMEYLEGHTLGARLAKGKLPLTQALEIGTQVADALAAAHRGGVIHRDLKPGNIVLTKTGAKLLDFGLAKLTGHGEQAAAASVASLPTQTPPLTSEGAIVGTLQYMAPEQVEGKPADARTDLWALGAILYEMLTGKRAFAGTSAASLITAIMASEPPALATLQPLAPPSLARLVRRCLAKAPDDRWDSAHDVTDELLWISQVGTAASAAGAALGVRPRRRSIGRVLTIAVGAAALAGVGAVAGWLAAKSASGPPPTVTRSFIDVRPAERVESVPAPTRGGSRTALAITPDGTRIVFVGRTGDVSRLYIRPLHSPVATELAATEGAESPTFSPDGRWIAFWAGGDLKKVPAAGGPVTPICRIESDSPPLGISWGDDGRIVFGLLRGGLRQVSSDGGKPAALTKLRPGEVSHRLPFVMPGSKWVLFTARESVWLWGTEQVVALSLVTGERKTVMVGGTDARYVPTGHLLYLQLGTLMARAYDPETQTVRGPAVGLVEQVAQAADGSNEPHVTGAGQYAVSLTGTLLYLAGGVPSPGRSELVALAARGESQTGC
jgi:eukaryotic-like serine/threonine-protein kinase